MNMKMCHRTGGVNNEIIRTELKTTATAVITTKRNVKNTENRKVFLKRKCNVMVL